MSRISPYSSLVWSCFVSLQCAVLLGGHLLAEEVEDKTGKVYEGLAELVVLRDKVQQRYVMHARGEKHTVYPGKLPIVRGIDVIRIVRPSRKFDYIGRAVITSPEEQGDGRERQRWMEVARCNGKLFCNVGAVNPNYAFEEKPRGITEGRFLAEHLVQQLYFEPLEDIVGLGNSIISNTPSHGTVERVFLNGATFVSSEVVVNSNVRSVWHWKYGDFDYEITLLQGAAVNYLPIEVSYKERGDGPWKEYFSHTRTHWARVKDVWLPDRVETAYASFAGGVVTNQFFLKLQWLVGEDAGDQFFQCGAFDYRVPVMQAFDVEFPYVIDGVVIQTKPWEAPEDLAIDGESLREPK